MNYTREEADVIIADSFRDLNVRGKKLLLAAQKGGEKSAIYEGELIKSCGAGVYNKLREDFRSPDYRDRIFCSLEKAGVKCVTAKSAFYPDGLRHIDPFPLVLYTRGNAELLKKRIFCVVGSRKSSAQTLEQCKAICKELSAHVVIATGVADGADRAAALGALDSGNVICVLPGGHANSDVTLKMVEERGLSISIFPPATPVLQYMFALRNSVLAGLAEGVLVVSAGINGGALSTANYALDYGKDVFAFPYNIGVASGEGCNNLIKSGAYLCDRAEDVLAAMRIECGERESDEELDGDEAAVMDALRSEGELHAEKIAALTGKSTSEITVICSLLEIKGLLVRTGGNKFAAVK